MNAHDTEEPTRPTTGTLALVWRYLSYATPYRGLVALVICAGIAKFTLPLIPARVRGWISNECLPTAGSEVESDIALLRATLLTVQDG